LENRRKVVAKSLRTALERKKKVKEGGALKSRVKKE
jgi:hypothetical protein